MVEPAGVVKLLKIAHIAIKRWTSQATGVSETVMRCTKTALRGIKCKSEQFCTVVGRQNERRSL